MELPKRKQNRLAYYDYSSANAYFLTVCTAKHELLFWASEDGTLSRYGEMAKQAILDIPKHYAAVTVDHYTVMPNHIHLLLQTQTDIDGRRIAAPTISTLMNQLKGAVSRQAGKSVWQKGFYDHIVRTDADYQAIWNYIEGNPSKWKEDKYHL